MMIIKTSAPLLAPVKLVICFLFLLAFQPALASQGVTADFNGDGYEDLAVGVPNEDIDGIVDAGAVQILYGTPQGIGTQNQLWHLNSPGIQLEASANDRLGSAIANGDFNQDGYADLAIGIPFRASTQGEVLVLYGSTSGLTATGNQVWDQGILKDNPEWDDRFGSALATGDFNADGYSDLAIGVPGEDFVDLGPPNHDPRIPKCTRYANNECPNAGIVNLVYGGPAGLTKAGNQLWHQDKHEQFGGWVEWEDCFGSSLAVGDFDNNGADDLAVGVPCEHTGGADVLGRDHGAVTAFFGEPNVGLSITKKPQYIRQWAEGCSGTPQSADAYAFSLATTDINGDGFDDLVIGAPGEEHDTVSGVTDAGGIAVFYGAASDGLSRNDINRNEFWCKVKTGLGKANKGAHWGWALATGDFNADGFGDIAVGAPSDNVGGINEAGTVSILFGHKNHLSGSGNKLISQNTAGIVDAAEGSDWFGYSLISGDFNGDGVPDLAVGTPFEDVGAHNMGAMNLLYGTQGIGLTSTGNQLLHQNSLNIIGQGESWDEFGGRLVPNLKTDPWPDRPANGYGDNTPPELTPIGSKTVTEGQLLTIALSASDTDGPTPLILEATGLPTGATFVDFTEGRGSFNWVPDIGAANESPYAVTFTATEDGGAGLTTSETVAITVIPADGGGDGMLSGFSAISPANVNLTSEGSTDWAHWALSSGTDVDHKSGVTPQISALTFINDTLTNRGTDNLTVYSWIDGTPTTSASNTASGLRAYRLNKGFEFTVAADTIIKTLKVYVGAKNVGGRLEASLSDGSAPAYVTQIDEFSGTTARVITLDFQAASAGQTLTVRYFLYSKPGSKGWISLESATLQSEVGNLAPSITSAAVTSGNSGVVYIYDVEASDPNSSDILTFDLTAAPLGMSIEATTGLISWTPDAAQSGDNSVTVSVCDDGVPVLCDSQNFIVSVSEANVAPSITSTPVTIALEGVVYSYDVEATDINAGDILTYSLTTAPVGMSIETNTGLINWTPSTIQVGTDHEVVVTVTDNSIPVLFDNQSFNVTVIANNVEPVISSSPITSASEGLPYSYDVEATDFNTGDILTYDLIEPPIGMSIDSITGLIEWTPDASQVGDNSITVLVCDDGFLSLCASQSFTIAVAAAEINVAPEITSNPITSALEGVTYDYLVEATDLNMGDTLSYSLIESPAGMSIDPQAGLISWTPTSDQLGAHSVTVAVTDNGVPALSDEQMFTLNVQSAPVDGLILGQIALSSGNIILSDEGTADWAHWALSSGTDVNRKSGVTPQISDLTFINNTLKNRGTNNLTIYSWIDGIPTTSVSNTTAGLRAYRLNKGFEFTVPADTDIKTLKIYVGAKNVGGQLEASLSDNSAPAFITQINQFSGTTSRVITLDFQAASAGQTLTVRYYLYSKPSTTGWISLEAATVQGEVGNLAPNISSTAATNAIEGMIYYYDIEASDPNVTDTLNFDLTTAPSGMSIDATTGLLSWTPDSNQVGEHLVTISVCDNGTPILCDYQMFTVSVHAASGEGSIIGLTSLSSGNVNLSAEGIADWAHWGLSTGTDVNRKSGVTTQISDLTLINRTLFNRGKDSTTVYSWTDGSPTQSMPITNSGLRAYFTNKGFEFTIPADTSMKSLSVYVGAKNVGGQLEASLSDGSAPAYITRIDQFSGTTSRVITLDFQAASIDQTLKVRYFLYSRPGTTGWISLESATLH